MQHLFLINIVNPLHLASKNVGEYTPEIYSICHTFNLVNCYQHGFQVYTNTCPKYIGTLWCGHFEYFELLLLLFSAAGVSQNTNIIFNENVAQSSLCEA